MAVTLETLVPGAGSAGAAGAAAGAGAGGAAGAGGWAVVAMPLLTLLTLFPGAGAAGAAGAGAAAGGVVVTETLETLLLFKIVWRSSQACSFSSVPLRVWF